MVPTIRRGKLLDVALCALILVLFGAIPGTIVLRKRFQDDKLETAYLVFLCLSWPLLVQGALTLLFYWRKDRTIDRQHVSTLTARDLLYVFLASIAVAFAFVLVLVAMVLNTVDRITHDRSILILFIVVAILLMMWITYSVLSFSIQVRRARTELREQASDDCQARPKSIDVQQNDLQEQKNSQSQQQVDAELEQKAKKETSSSVV